MATVMIRCPRTDRAVSTEIETERPDFERLPEVQARLRCPVFCEVHVWTRSNAWLAEATLVPDTDKSAEPVSGPVNPTRRN